MTGPGPRLAPERLPEVTATLAAHAAECDRAGCYRDVLCARVHTPQDDTIVAAVGNSVLEIREGQ